MSVFAFSVHPGLLHPHLLVGVLLIATPDGAEIASLAASILLTVAFFPYGMRLIRGGAHRATPGGAHRAAASSS